VFRVVVAALFLTSLRSGRGMTSNDDDLQICNSGATGCTLL
jgi:hypothetical protein